MADRNLVNNLRAELAQAIRDRGGYKNMYEAEKRRTRPEPPSVAPVPEIGTQEMARLVMDGFIQGFIAGRADHVHDPSPLNMEQLDAKLKEAWTNFALLQMFAAGVDANLKHPKNES